MKGAILRGFSWLRFHNSGKCHDLQRNICFDSGQVHDRHSKSGNEMQRILKM